MSDHDDHSGVVSWRSAAGQVAPVVTVLVLLGVLVVPPAPGGSHRAAVTVGLISAEAIVLYVGYGALTRVARSAVRERLGWD